MSISENTQCKLVHFRYTWFIFNIVVRKIRPLLDYTSFQESTLHLVLPFNLHTLKIILRERPINFIRVNSTEFKEKGE